MEVRSIEKETMSYIKKNEKKRRERKAVYPFEYKQNKNKILT